MRKFERRFLFNLDWMLVISTLLLCVIGLGIIYSAGYAEAVGASPVIKKQATSVLIGLAFFSFGVIVNPVVWRDWAVPIYLLGCALLLVVLFTGHVAGGAQRWIAVGGMRLQPSELTKVALIFACAKVFSSNKAPINGYNLKTLLFPLLVMAIPAGLILRQPDLGTALCHFLIGGSMLLLAGVRGRTLAILAVTGGLLLVPAWYMLEDYQRSRVVNFLSPEQDPLGSGYHAIQSKIAVGSGSLTGKGFLEGTQTQLSFLPEQTTDFIFSVLAEEWGFIGSTFVLSIYLLLIFRLLAIAGQTSDSFCAYLSVGVAALIFWHLFVNIGMVIGILPVVGLTLPLLSFGGSSAISILAALGIVVGISARKYSFA